MSREALARAARAASAASAAAIRTHGLCSPQARQAIEKANRAWAKARAAGLTPDQINTYRGET